MIDALGKNMKNSRYAVFINTNLESVAEFLYSHNLSISDIVLYKLPLEEKVDFTDSLMNSIVFKYSFENNKTKLIIS